MQRITAVREGSIAQEAGIEAGDGLISINGKKIVDVIDYEFLCAQEKLLLQIDNARDKTIVELEIEKDEEESLGLEFASGLMSPQRTCGNNCMFCFVDQMPKNCRQTLYVKDDDWRLSFIMGNFITLTNVSDNELQRIIDRRVSPLYISVQATEPQLREKLMRNKHAGKLMDQLKKLKDAGLKFHCQLVLCHDLNDGEHLSRSLNDLWGLYPAAQTVAVVPVGLTRHREGLSVLTPYDAVGAREVLDIVEQYQQKCKAQQGTCFVFASDEFYFLTGRDMPSNADYEGFAQIENGIGMTRKFEKEFETALADMPKGLARGKYTLATGVLAQGWLQKIADTAAAHTGAKLTVRAITNRFFGDTVTAAGLVVGTDLIDTLRGEELGDALLIPRCMLRERDDVFLDGLSVADVERALGIKVVPVNSGGDDFLKAIVDNY